MQAVRPRLQDFARAWIGFLEAPEEGKRALASVAMEELEGWLTQGRAGGDRFTQEHTLFYLAQWHRSLAEDVEREAPAKFGHLNAALGYASQACELAPSPLPRGFYLMFLECLAAEMADCSEPADRRAWAERALRYGESFVENLPSALVDALRHRAEYERMYGVQRSLRANPEWSLSLHEVAGGRAWGILAEQEASRPRRRALYRKAIALINAGLDRAFGCMQREPNPAGVRLLLGIFYALLPRFLERYVEEKQRGGRSITFDDARSQKVFAYLLQSVGEDTGLRRSEDMGWRSLPRISREAGVSRKSLYGREHFNGRVLADLRRSGVIEERIETGARGRGGEVLRIRIKQPRADSSLTF